MDKDTVQRERDRLKMMLKHMDEATDASGNPLSDIATETRASLVRRIAEFDRLLSDSGDA